jgi:hypothetical protein
MILWREFMYLMSHVTHLSHTSPTSNQVRDSMLAGVSGAGAMVDSSIDITAAVAAASEHSQLRRSLSSEYFAGKLPSQVGRCCSQGIVPCCCWCHHSRILLVFFASSFHFFLILILFLNSHLLSERSLQSQRRWCVTAAAAAARWTEAARAAAAEAFVVVALSIQHSSTTSRCSQTAGNNQHHHHHPHRHHHCYHHLFLHSIISHQRAHFPSSHAAFSIFLYQELKTPEKKKQIEQVTAPSPPPPPPPLTRFCRSYPPPFSLSQDLEAMRSKLEALGIARLYLKPNYKYKHRVVSNNAAATIAAVTVSFSDHTLTRVTIFRHFSS